MLVDKINSVYWGSNSAMKPIFNFVFSGAANSELATKDKPKPIFNTCLNIISPFIFSIQES